MGPSETRHRAAEVVAEGMPPAGRARVCEILTSRVEEIQAELAGLEVRRVDLLELLEKAQLGVEVLDRFVRGAGGMSAWGLSNLKVDEDFDPFADIDAAETIVEDELLEAIEPAHDGGAYVPTAEDIAALEQLRNEPEDARPWR